MDLCIIIKGMSFFLQTSVGIISNCVILLSYATILYSKCKLMPVDIVLSHLAFVNMMVLLTRGVPQTMTVFGINHVLNDVFCKVIVYIYRIVRALSVCVTCLLTVLQAVTISPNIRWSFVKLKDMKFLSLSLVSLWVINMAVCIAAPFFSALPRNVSIPSFTLNLGFCYVYFPDQMSYIFNGFAVSFRDFAFVAIMVFTSYFILRTLYRHRKQVQGIRRQNGDRNLTAETKAAQDVLRLVLLYVIFFGIDNIIWIYMLTVSQVPSTITDMRVFFSSCYASLSPILIIFSNRKIQNGIKCAMKQKTVEVYVCQI
ncbi:olfactory receptor class A-like protein 1 [Bufo gargarizans]|uniref:olfactory receptor class A-like protein 1 n=1 Tax=Bufo gargarizans TaxID=30331 RepID=UPI001CF108A2|nr:olfactory receptor class A-like protein 1 [Bufo gargarizans]